MARLRIHESRLQISARIDDETRQMLAQLLDVRKASQNQVVRDLIRDEFGRRNLKLKARDQWADPGAPAPAPKKRRLAAAK